jgi:hypothetical protein
LHDRQRRAASAPVTAQTEQVQAGTTAP